MQQAGQSAGNDLFQLKEELRTKTRELEQAHTSLRACEQQAETAQDRLAGELSQAKKAAGDAGAVAKTAIAKLAEIENDRPYRDMDGTSPQHPSHQDLDQARKENDDLSKRLRKKENENELLWEEIERLNNLNTAPDAAVGSQTNFPPTPDSTELNDGSTPSCHSENEQTPSPAEPESNGKKYPRLGAPGDSQTENHGHGAAMGVGNGGSELGQCESHIAAREKAHFRACHKRDYLQARRLFEDGEFKALNKGTQFWDFSRTEMRYYVDRDTQPPLQFIMDAGDFKPTTLGLALPLAHEPNDDMEKMEYAQSCIVAMMPELQFQAASIFLSQDELAHFRKRSFPNGMPFGKTFEEKENAEIWADCLKYLRQSQRFQSAARFWADGESTWSDLPICWPPTFTNEDPILECQLFESDEDRDIWYAYHSGELSQTMKDDLDDADPENAFAIFDGHRQSSEKTLIRSAGRVGIKDKRKSKKLPLESFMKGASSTPSDIKSNDANAGAINPGQSENVNGVDPNPERFGTDEDGPHNHSTKSGLTNRTGARKDRERKRPANRGLESMFSIQK